MGESDVKVEIRLVPAKASTPHRVTSRPALALRGRGARAPMAVQATSQSRNKRNRVKQPVNLVTPRLENLSMYSGYTHSTAHKKSGCRGARQAVDRLLLVRTHGSNYLRVFFPQALRRAGNCIVLFYPFPCCFSTVATGFTNRKHIPPATALATASICRAGRSSSWLPA